jgi:hypothetical protein
MFRLAGYLAMGISLVWTLVLALPYDDTLPVMIGGGAGTWLLFGYLAYLAVGVAGFAALSALLSTIETQERKSLNPIVMAVGLSFLFAGVTATCLLLGAAGASGGYAQTIQHVTEGDLQSMLSPYLDPLRGTVSISAIGAATTIAGMATAKGEKQSE